MCRPGLRATKTGIGLSLQAKRKNIVQRARPLSYPRSALASLVALFGADGVVLTLPAGAAAVEAGAPLAPIAVVFEVVARVVPTVVDLSQPMGRWGGVFERISAATLSQSVARRLVSFVAPLEGGGVTPMPVPELGVPVATCASTAPAIASAPAPASVPLRIVDAVIPGLLG
jgi:hypothetical protein